MKILVTGGAGFIGSSLIKVLRSQGHDAIGMDIYTDCYDRRIKYRNSVELPIFYTDIRRPDKIDEVFRLMKPELVIHLAALANVRKSIGNEIEYTRTNILGTLNILNACVEHGVNDFIQASTSSVYGNNSVPFSETQKTDSPLAAYPATKKSAELFAHSYNNLYDINVSSLRFFNVYGPHGRPDMMPLKIIDNIVNDKMITVFSFGRLKRDWTYIDDVVNGIILSSKNMKGCKIYNIGFGSPVSLNRFIDITEKTIGKNAKIFYDDTPKSEPDITYCDTTFAENDIGFVAKVDVEEGVFNLWKWYKEMENKSCTY